jgi:hypothetical protein
MFKDQRAKFKVGIAYGDSFVKDFRKVIREADSNFAL